MSAIQKSNGTRHWADAIAEAIKDEKPPKGAMSANELADKWFEEGTREAARIAVRREAQRRGLKSKVFGRMRWYWP